MNSEKEKKLIQKKGKNLENGFLEKHLKRIFQEILFGERNLQCKMDQELPILQIYSIQ